MFFTTESPFGKLPSTKLGTGRVTQGKTKAREEKSGFHAVIALARHLVRHSLW